MSLCRGHARRAPMHPSLFCRAVEKVTGGKIKVDAKLDGIPVYSDTLDLCQTLFQAGLKCPIGPMSGRKSLYVTLPVFRVRQRRCTCACTYNWHYYPSQGQITAESVVTDQNGKELACVDLDFKL